MVRRTPNREGDGKPADGDGEGTEKMEQAQELGHQDRGGAQYDECAQTTVSHPFRLHCHRKVIMSPLCKVEMSS